MCFLLSSTLGRKKSNEISRIISYCKQKTEGMYKDPQRCDSYVICSKEGAYHMKCPLSLWFNSLINKCDKPVNVDCNGKKIVARTDLRISPTILSINLFIYLFIYLLTY